MTLFKAEDGPNSGDILRQAFESNYLMQNQRLVGFIAMAAGLLQLVLLVPDLTHISQASGRALVLVMRIITSICVLVFAGFCLKQAIRTFRVFSWLVSLFEGSAIITFLLVFHLYDQPHFVIQAMGMIFLIMMIFFVPNQWFKMVALAVIGVLAFALSAWLKLGNSLPANEFWAGVFYMSAAFGLCAMVSYTLDLRSLNEFMVKQELIQLNTIDPLTLACNRTKLIADFDYWSAYCGRYHQPLSLALFDIDRFKAINDDFGHQKADQVLVELVNMIKEQLRKTDMIARWGGDEFIIMFPGVKPEQAEQVLHRIRQSLHDKPLTGSIPVTCSFGVTGLTPDVDLDTLIREADALMYQAKRVGGDGICRKQENIGSSGLNSLAEVI
jgi:two-component system cell cycle response regulator